jgi:hypothetical protein
MMRERLHAAGRTFASLCILLTTAKNMAKTVVTGGMSPFGPKILGAPDATEPKARAREIEQAQRFARRADSTVVYLGQKAKDQFGSPKDEKFPDVVASLGTDKYAVGEGKGTDMAKVIQQFVAAGRRLASVKGHITVQEVVVDKLIHSEFSDPSGRLILLAGPGYGVDAHGFLLDMRGPGPSWLQQLVNGVPIQVIVFP